MAPIVGSYKRTQALASRIDCFFSLNKYSNMACKVISIRKCEKLLKINTRVAKGMQANLEVDSRCGSLDKRNTFIL
jgi:hypothetical protein